MDQKALGGICGCFLEIIMRVCNKSSFLFYHCLEGFEGGVKRHFKVRPPHEMAMLHFVERLLPSLVHHYKLSLLYEFSYFCLINLINDHILPKFDRCLLFIRKILTSISALVI